MQKAILLISLLALNSTIVFPQSIRNVNFGMTKSEVRSNETAEFAMSDTLNYLEILAFKDNLGGLDAYIGYIFTQNKLTRVRYAFREFYLIVDNYIDDFEDINNILIKKYGKPLNEKTFYWDEDISKDDRSNYGMSITLGDLKLRSEWDQDGMVIFHILEGDITETSHIVEYQSKKFIQLEEEARKNANMSDF